MKNQLRWFAFSDARLTHLWLIAADSLQLATDKIQSRFMNSHYYKENGSLWTDLDGFSDLESLLVRYLINSVSLAKPNTVVLWSGSLCISCHRYFDFGRNCCLISCFACQIDRQ